MLHDTIRAFAPATIANLGPGFDLLGAALERPGDTVTARLVGEGGVRLTGIDGDDGQLAGDPDGNTAVVAAREVLRRTGRDVGVEMHLEKGIPIGSGLGSSAASAAAAALAVNRLLGNPLRKIELVPACIEAEASVSGRHADNVAPAVLGGLILVRSLEPLDIIRLPVPEGLSFAVVTPRYALSTREARSVLPDHVPLSAHVTNAANVAGILCALHSGDLGLLSRSMVDSIVEPSRLPLIPGGEAVIRAARDAGALASSISGAGPSIFALAHSPTLARDIATVMVEAFQSAGHDAEAVISPADCPGARKR